MGSALARRDIWAAMGTAARSLLEMMDAERVGVCSLAVETFLCMKRVVSVRQFPTLISYEILTLGMPVSGVAAPCSRSASTTAADVATVLVPRRPMAARGGGKRSAVELGSRKEFHTRCFDTRGISSSTHL